MFVTPARRGRSRRAACVAPALLRMPVRSQLPGGCAERVVGEGGAHRAGQRESRELAFRPPPQSACAQRRGPLVGLARETLQAPDLNIRMILRPSLTCLAFTSVFITLQTLVDKEGQQKWFHDELSPEGQDTLGRLLICRPGRRPGGEPPPSSCGLPERRTASHQLGMHAVTHYVLYVVYRDQLSDRRVNNSLCHNEVDADRQCWVEQSIVVAAKRAHWGVADATITGSLAAF